MTSTHTGNPICAAAALANLTVIEEQDLVAHARRMGEVMQPLLGQVGERFRDHVAAVHGKGLVAALHIVHPGGIEPNPQLAADIVRRCVEKGLLMFAPVGYGGASVKVSPPLVIDEEAIRESVPVLEEAIEEAIS
jgi:4-aminobutyrate aminotransferase/diaminobutyrate-pyruvate transaminase/4-aminobutyrate aminotransferase/(S)-3-amino-2-methylpropionate transaminase